MEQGFVTWRFEPRSLCMVGKLSVLSYILAYIHVYAGTGNMNLDSHDSGAGILLTEPLI